MAAEHANKITVGVESSLIVKRNELASPNQQKTFGQVKRNAGPSDSFEELLRSINRLRCGMIIILFRFFGDYYSEVKTQIDDRRSFFESKSVHKEILKRIRLSHDSFLFPDFWRYCIDDAVPLLLLGVHSRQSFNKCLKRFDQQIDAMVDQARAFDSTDKFIEDLWNALPLPIGRLPKLRKMHR